MNHVQKQSILIVLQGIEQQVQALKNLITITTGEPEKTLPRSEYSGRYTSEDDDKMIAAALEIDPAEVEKDMFIKDLMEEAAAKAQDMEG